MKGKVIFYQRMKINVSSFAEKINANYFSEKKKNISVFFLF